MNEIVELIRAKVKNINIGESLPAVSISGGIDSTTILYHVIHDLMGGNSYKVRTFTAVFNNDEDEQEKAKRVADFFGTVHTEVFITKRDILSLLPLALKHYPFPRYNVWPWRVVGSAATKNLSHFFIGEGSDEIFGYPDRSFTEGWAGQLVWVWPAWQVPCDVFGLKLHAPFMDIQGNDWTPVTKFYKAPDKELLRQAYKGILPDFVIGQTTTPPSRGFYKMMGMIGEELQTVAVRAWLEARNEIHNRTH